MIVRSIRKENLQITSGKSRRVVHLPKGKSASFWQWFGKNALLPCLHDHFAQPYHRTSFLAKQRTPK